MNLYVIGLDLGQQSDYTALSIVEPELVDVAAKENSNQGVNPSHPEKNLELRVRYLKRYPLKTTYLSIAKDVTKIVKKYPGSSLLIDKTGVGIAIYDIFNETGSYTLGISIHGGDNIRFDQSTYYVPKRDLIAALIIAFQRGELKIAEALPETKVLIDELANYTMTINLNSGNDTYGPWREGLHDDMVLSLAMPVWYIAYTKPYLPQPPYLISYGGGSLPRMGGRPRSTRPDFLWRR